METKTVITNEYSKHEKKFIFARFAVNSGVAQCQKAQSSVGMPNRKLYLNGKAEKLTTIRDL
jgi:hypothetical protein